MKELSGWGKFPRIKVKEFFPNSEAELLQIIRNHESYIARGSGRSYGDSSINKNLTITMTKINRLISWNNATGELIAESGILIKDIIHHCLEQGWFPFVTPGTKYVTLGGAIACDVHGKNHHAEGSFGNCVNWIEIITEKNEVIRCSKEKNADLFNWTIGGMGLTGIILKCSVQLKKVETGWVNQTVIVNNNFEETLKSFNEHYNTLYSVAWIDCLAKGESFGRSILMLGEHAKLGEIANLEIFPKIKKQKISIFFDAPSFLLNNFTVSIFNRLYFYFYFYKRKSANLVDWDSYFYPLDAIANWNRIYGRKGFFQFQCVLPKKNSLEGYKQILSYVQKKSSGSFLAVLKLFGPGRDSLSFPREGYTLSLDFKVTSRNILVAKELTRIVNNFGGMIYLAKDSLMNAEEFKCQIDSELKNNFRQFVNKKNESEQSNRINL